MTSSSMVSVQPTKQMHSMFKQVHNFKKEACLNYYFQMMRMKMHKKMYKVNVGYKYYIATDSNISDMSLLHGMNTQQCLLTQVSTKP